MNRMRSVVVLVLASVFMCAGGAEAGGLTPFASEAELARFFKKVLATRPVPPPGPDFALESAVVTVSVTGARAADSSITNNQETGVDEGDIVKRHGDMLVVLRRGRLFTVSLDGLKPVDAIDAFPPGVDARSDWYDEMVIAGDVVAVIGYSYGRGGTEINRFSIDGAGHLQFLDCHHIRSNDYYSARNYATRLIGSRLILYTPRYLGWGGRDYSEILPGMRRWSGDAKTGFVRIADARRIYHAPTMPPQDIEALHTVTSCDLAAKQMRCEATALFGPAGRVFYVSQQAVHVWTSSYRYSKSNGYRIDSMLFRLPLDGARPGAVKVHGAPTDQFSFREDAGLGVLNVLVRAEGKGDAMWASEFSQGAVSLLRLRMKDFGDGSRQMPRSRYRMLPMPDGQYYTMQNRFVGDYVLYGRGQGWGPQIGKSMLVVAPLAAGLPRIFMLPHDVSRIEVMGRDAVVVGGGALDTYFTSVLLSGSRPALGDRYVMKGGVQSETRSHGFFFKLEDDQGNGVLGLPVTRPARPVFHQLFETSAKVLFLRRRDGRFSLLGELDSHPDKAVRDGCVASCVDWYGNARPIFIGERILALMGYELIEGGVDGGKMDERGRVDFTPTLSRSSPPAP